MFSKLLKHDWKSNGGLLGLLSLCAIGAGVLGGLVLRAIVYLTEQIQEQNANVAVGISGLSTLLVFLILALVAYAFAVQFINVLRFYKSRFTDEGYLTFTLPVTARQIFLSSFLHMMFWQIISGLVLIAAVCAIVFIGIDREAMEAIKSFSELFGVVDETMQQAPGYGAYQVLSTLQSLVAPIYSIMLLMTSVTLGAVLAKKHKIWTAIGMYFGIQMAVGIVESILSTVPTIMLLASSLQGEDNYMYYMATSSGLTMALQLGLIVGGYFLSTGLMKNKLNLP